MLTAADSLILDFLRGWRLLKGATLSKEERRDVLSSTQNNIDFVSIQEALLTLYDEQGYSHGNSSGVNKHYIAETSDYPDYDYNDTYYAADGWYADDGWYDTGGGDDFYNEHQGQWAQPAPSAGDHEDDEDTANIHAAEILAAEANRTLASAREAAANARRDRGFGKGTG